MKKIIAMAVLLGISNLSYANDGQQRKHRFTEYADVISVSPIFKKIRHQQPTKECWIEHEEVVTYQGNTQQYNGRQHYNGRGRAVNGRSGGEAIIGGIIGGVIGNQLGRNGSRSTRNGATVAGAIIGSAIANESSGTYSRHRGYSNHRRYQRPQKVVQTRPVERCRETVHTSYENRVQSYDVTYRYRGQTFTTRMKRDPGSQIELQVNVAPARH